MSIITTQTNHIVTSVSTHRVSNTQHWHLLIVHISCCGSVIWSVWNCNVGNTYVSNSQGLPAKLKIMCVCVRFRTWECQGQTFQIFNPESFNEPHVCETTHSWERDKLMWSSVKNILCVLFYSVFLCLCYMCVRSTDIQICHLYANQTS